MSSDEKIPKPAPWVLAVGAGVWLLSIGVLWFLFDLASPPFQGSWIVAKWAIWCAALALAGSAFLLTGEFVLHPLIEGSGEPGEAIIRTGAFGIIILVIVHMVSCILLD